jgi:2'-5' RNA ligase
MKTRPFNIVIYPPQEIIEQAITISKKLHRKGGLFILDNKKYFPHLTLYTVELSVKNTPQVIKMLKNLSLKLKPFIIASTKYQQNETGFTNITFQRSKQLDQLQKQIIRAAQPWSEGYLKKQDQSQMKNLAKTEQKNFKQYDYRNVGTLFSPHITFTKLKKYNPDAFLSIPKINFSFRVEKIGFFYLSEHGTCTKLIKIFDLS